MGQFLDKLVGNYILLTPLIFPILLLIIKFFKSSFRPNSPPLPPGPTPWPILGNIPHMAGGTMPHVAFTNFAKLYGPLISLKFGTQCLIVGSSPDVVKEFLTTRDRVLSGRYISQSSPITKSELNQSSLAWADSTHDWKRLRTLCKTELFSNRAIESQASLMEKNVNDLMIFLRDREGKVIKIAELVFATVFNMLGNSLMSRNFIRLDEKNEDGGLKGLIREAMEGAAAPNLADFFPILSKLDLQGLQRRSKEFHSMMQSVWGPIIEERRNTKADSFRHQDFLNTLQDNHFTDDRINNFITELFSAGTDTTTSTIEWTMAELLRNPKTMSKVRQEIESQIKPEFPMNFQSTQYPYLNACIKEILRLHPPTPLALPRRALETCQVKNYTIPKNAQVMVNVWAIGRDPSIWEEPLNFKPERFLGSNVDFKGNDDFEFLPFGGGRRICPGIPMAAKTIPLILVSLIHYFDWSLADGEDPNELNMNEKFGVTMQMEHPLSLIFRARK